MNIRLAKTDDKKAIIELFNELRATWDGPQIEPEESLFDEILSDKNARIFILEDENLPIGFATLYFYPKLSNKRAFVSELLITSKKRSLGYGSKLLDYIKDYCKSEGVDTIKISTGVENKKAQKFYQKMAVKLRTTNSSFI